MARIGLDMLPTAIMTFFIVGIALGIGVLLLSDISNDTFRGQDTQINDTITLNNGTAVLLTHTDLVSCPAKGYNGSNTELSLGTGNYSCNTATGGLTLEDNTYNNQKFNFTYNYYVYKADFNATNNTISALGDFASWFGIIVIVLAAAIIIGLVTRSLAFGKRT